MQNNVCLSPQQVTRGTSITRKSSRIEEGDFPPPLKVVLPIVNCKSRRRHYSSSRKSPQANPYGPSISPVLLTRTPTWQYYRRRKSRGQIAASLQVGNPSELLGKLTPQGGKAVPARMYELPFGREKQTHKSSRDGKCSPEDYRRGFELLQILRQPSHKHSLDQLTLSGDLDTVLCVPSTPSLDLNSSDSSPRARFKGDLGERIRRRQQSEKKVMKSAHAGYLTPVKFEKKVVQSSRDVRDSIYRRRATRRLDHLF